MPTELDSIFSPVHRLLKKHEYEKAIACLVESSTGRLRRPYSYFRNHAWYCVGGAYFKLGKFDLAVAGFEKALRADPSDVACLWALGNCFDALGKPKLAERRLRLALDLKPIGREKAAILVNLGNSLTDQGRWAEAISCYQGPARRKDEIGRTARKNRKFAADRLRA